MSSSRRTFLALAGAGAAGVGLSSAIGLAGAESVGLAAPPREADLPPVPGALSGSLVAYIDDVHGDQLSLMIGENQVIVTDSALVARLAVAAAAHSADEAL